MKIESTTSGYTVRTCSYEVYYIPTLERLQKFMVQKEAIHITISNDVSLSDAIEIAQGLGSEYLYTYRDVKSKNWL
jgi:hypothetical protein